MVATKKIPVLILALLFSLSSCIPDADADKDEVALLESVPEWSRDAIWYQIFVERFRNGDPNNDPRPVDLAGGDPPDIPDSWSVTPWGHDWYQREAWIADLEVTRGFYHQIQMRRYGGDLQGVLDQMDYIAALGVTAIYFNPLNDAPSMHKYDARNWRHVDRNFGPDPDGDAAIMASETPDDPATWEFTAADKLFLEVVEEYHKRGIRVILDYSWNHTGTQFWAIHDLRKNGKESKYGDWFNVLNWDDPTTPEDEFEYEGWAGYKYMPVVKKDIIPEDDNEMPYEGNLHSPSLKQHIFNISRHWLDPNGDGDPSDGVDGYRLDVAGEVPMGFWREYRKVVRAVNPEAYILGEIWWFQWPESFLGPRPFLQGDQYDAIMNYRWYRIARGFFAQAEPILKPSEFVAGIEGINRDIRPEVLQAMMNMSSSHDAPRLSTSFYNKTMNKARAKPSDNPDYKIERPDTRTFDEVKLFLIHQFTFVGSPQIWNGDEVGMWGADDPDCRKPIVWEDLQYEDEVANYDPERPRRVDVVQPDLELLAFYQKLIAMRKENAVLSRGDLEFLLANDEQMTLAYRRSFGDQEIIVAFNRSDERQELEIPMTTEGSYRDIWQNREQLTVDAGKLTVNLPALGAAILLRE